MRISAALFALTIIMFLNIFAGSSFAEGAAQPIPMENASQTKSIPTAGGKVTAVSVPFLSFQELHSSNLRNLPNLMYLVKHGSVGAMNVRTPMIGLDDSYATIGAGAPVLSDDAFPPMNSDETMQGYSGADWYRQFLGKDQRNAQVVVPGVYAIQSQNRNGAYGAKPGLLGDLFQNNHIPVYVFGNSDTFPVHSEQSMQRNAPLMLMNSEGTIRYGDVGSAALLRDPNRPYFIRTSYKVILRDWEKTRRSSFVLIELGDLFRLYDQKKYIQPARFTDLKRQTLREIDHFIGAILEKSNSNDTLWVFSPLVHQDAMEKREMLAPIVYYGKDRQQGVLASDTTRRPGILANYDLAPTFLHEFGIKAPPDMIGLPLKWKPEQNALSQLESQFDKIVRIYTLRPKLLYPFAIYQIVVLLASLVFVLRKWKMAEVWMKICLFSILSAPVVMLWMGWMAERQTTFLTAFFLVTVFIVSWLLSRFQMLASLAVCGLVTALLILIDGFSGSTAMKQSVLGYDVMIGARYYGIGNEYMGVLIGACILGLTVSLEEWISKKGLRPNPGSSQKQTVKYPIWAPLSFACIGLVVIGFMAAPNIGTNAGGAITAVVAFSIAWIRIFGGNLLREVRWTRLFLLLAACIAVSFVGLWLFNVVLSGGAAQQSHIGRAMTMLFEGRIDVIANMIVRKLRMNWHLIGVSAWSKVLITSLFVIAVMVMRPRGVFREWQQRYPFIMYGYSANSIGAITALLFNDSGIVAAATMIVYVAVPMLLIKLQET